ncbi:MULTISPECIES: DUF6238 family protein [unclassified Streptomyces]|uniref:DUF6238 family protein n=1 Tax=unclassified Streptomyces TaxID=2593676 RepID=UPI0035DAC7D2
MSPDDRRDAFDGDAYPYLRAATAGLRHHTRAQSATGQAQPSDRPQLDALHAHLTALHRLIDQAAEQTRPERPAAGRHLAMAHARVWQAADSVHAAFHLVPAAAEDGTCHPERLPEGPPFLTICQRHLAAVHAIRRKTTAADLAS